MLNVSRANFTKIANNFTAKKILMNKGLATDVFVRNSAPISFKGIESPKSTNAFFEWAKETDFINTQLDDVLSNPENVLGAGFHHTAYKIPNNDDFVLRVSTNDMKYSFQRQNIPNAKIKAKSADLDINVGQEVARILVPGQYGDAEWQCTCIEVLKKQDGESIGVLPPELLVEGEYNSTTKAGVDPYEHISRKQHYAKTIHKVAELPVESYEKLLSDFTRACAYGFSFDEHNSNNLLVDSNKQAINLIDMDRSSSNPTKPNYGDLLYALTNVQYYSTYTSFYADDVSPEQKQQATDDTMQIIDKFMQAMKNNGLKFDKNSVTCSFFDLMRSTPSVKLCGYGMDGFFAKATQMGICN